MKAKFESEKNSKNKYRSSVVLKENEKKKDVKIDRMSVTWLIYLFPYFMDMHLWAKYVLYDKMHLNNVYVLKLFLK